MKRHAERARCPRRRSPSCAPSTLVTGADKPIRALTGESDYYGMPKSAPGRLVAVIEEVRVALSKSSDSLAARLLILHADASIRARLSDMLADRYCTDLVADLSGIPEPPPDLILADRDDRDARSSGPLILLC